jgi:hypothetical protein
LEKHTPSHFAPAPVPVSVFVFVSVPALLLVLVSTFPILAEALVDSILLSGERE